MLAATAGGGAFLALALGPRWSFVLSALSAWCCAGVVLLGLGVWQIVTADADQTRARAADEDPGRAAVTVLVLLASTVSLLSAAVLVGRARNAAGAEGHALVALCLATVILAWALTQTAFSLRYAHLYYREDDEGVGGVEFPGGRPPDLLDFAYLAFTVGMCFQVSDAVVSSPQVRRTVLLHALLAFFYNSAILAFVLNLVFNLAN